LAEIKHEIITDDKEQYEKEKNPRFSGENGNEVGPSGLESAPGKG